MDEPVITNSSAEAAADVAFVPSGPRDDIERKAMALAQEFFPGPAHVEDACDPEDPTWQRRVIVVTARGTPEEVVRREIELDYRIVNELGRGADHIIIELNFPSEAS
jgi:hypothetical protein